VNSPLLLKRPHEKWDKFLSLNYPTAADIAKFKQRKAEGLVPASAKIGGGIGIHGTWPKRRNGDRLLPELTNGCISMKRDDVG
jgi:hypothetical protein